MATKVFTWNPATNVAINADDDSSLEIALSGSNPVFKFAPGTLLSVTALAIQPIPIAGGGVPADFGVNSQPSGSTFAGTPLRINAGGADPATADLNGGFLQLVSGGSRGIGRSPLYLGAPIPGLTGTTQNPAVDQFYINSIPVVNAGTNIATFALPALAGASLEIHYQYYATDGTDVHAMSGVVSISCVNKAGSITKQITDSQTGPTGGTFSKAVSAGTITSAVTLSGTTTQTIVFTPTDSLTPTIQRLDYKIISNVELTLL